MSDKKEKPDWSKEEAKQNVRSICSRCGQPPLAYECLTCGSTAKHYEVIKYNE